jgi:hypothetical protein
MMEETTNYRIKVLGELDAKWSDRLGGMGVNVDRKEGQKSVTTLVGPLRDQAALAGIMSTLHELHLSVLSVECLDD